ncbi:hypothetical protein ABIE00_005278 [Arthrobacter sp. OAP107]
MDDAATRQSPYSTERPQAPRSRLRRFLAVVGSAVLGVGVFVGITGRWGPFAGISADVWLSFWGSLMSAGFGGLVAGVVLRTQLRAQERLHQVQLQAQERLHREQVAVQRRLHQEALHVQRDEARKEREIAAMTDLRAHIDEVNEYVLDPLRSAIPDGELQRRRQLIERDIRSWMLNSVNSRAIWRVLIDGTMRLFYVYEELREPLQELAEDALSHYRVEALLCVSSISDFIHMWSEATTDGERQEAIAVGGRALAMRDVTFKLGPRPGPA